ncbi:alpha/beta-hydrolase [Trichoderma sp. SZMC 28013]
MSHPTLTRSERIDIVVAIAEILLSGLFGLFTALFQGSTGAPGYSTRVIHHILRKTARLSVAQFQYLDRNTSTDLVYSQFAGRTGIPENSILLSDGTRCHWIGSKECKRVLLYFPGSFVLPSSRFNLQFVANCARTLEHEGREAAVLVVSTDLAPGSQYPRQLSQGATVLKYLLEKTGRNPSDITLVGDSAAGNLALALLSHISHPLPNVPLVELREDLQGVILVSPITDFDAATQSAIENSKRDWLDQSAIRTWGDNYAGHSVRDIYINPGWASEEWWKDIKVKKAIVLFGEYELARDSIQTWVTKFKKHNPATTVILGQGEFHAQPVMDLIRGSKVPSKQAEALRLWLIQSLWL